MSDPDDPTVIDDTDTERELRQALIVLAEQQRSADGLPTTEQLVSAARALRSDEP